ncbi:hypothetical protein M5D96_009112, partial [Drosophila gunungcola]
MFVQLLTKNKLTRQQLLDIKRNNRNLRCNANTLNLPDRQFFQSYRIDKDLFIFLTGKIGPDLGQPLIAHVTQ